MLISELIELLEREYDKHGDVQIIIDADGNNWLTGTTLEYDRAHGRVVLSTAEA